MSGSELFRAERLPVLQNRMFASAAEARTCTTGDVVLVQDRKSGLVLNEAFDPSRLDYDHDYQNEQAWSGVFKRHLGDVSDVIGRHFREASLLEVGCGKGYFLEHLKSAGFDISGIDPAYEGDNPDVIKARFEKGLGISAEGIVLRHVLEHVPEPLTFLAGLAEANDGKGAIYIEVPCFDWICRQRAWFDVFYEHVNYFRLADLHRCFARVHESGHLFGGQYLYVVADLASVRVPVAVSDDRVDFPADFLEGVRRSIDTLKMCAGQRNAIWGGASKGVMFSLYVQRAGYDFEEVIDINPAKQGCYLAGSGLRVSSPEEALDRLPPPSNIFVMNSNYLDEITARSGGRHRYITVEHERI